MSSDPASRTVSDLNTDELEWLEHHRELLAAIVEQEGIELPDQATILDACDGVVRWWHAQPESERPDANMVVNAAGIGLGDALADVFELEWRIVEDEGGSSLVLWRDEPRTIVAPIDGVAKRFADSPSGFVNELYSGLAEQLDALLEGGQPG
jgi:hypothetical protein